MKFLPRILLVDNLMIRRYGNLRMGPGRKLNCGAVRNGWRICEFSDRDMARLLAPLGVRSIGARIANRKLVKTARNFRPNVMLLGHCDYITNDTLDEIRAALPGIRIAHFNVDPLWQESTRRQMDERRHSCDALFATTAGEVLSTWKTGGNTVAFMPNPSDLSMENCDNSAKTDFVRDLFFAGNPRAGDPRWELLAEVLPAIEGKLKCEIFGGKANGIWGARYEEVLASSKMSLNLNRREGDKWYSSDRIAHLMGCGILTFQSSKNRMQDFFSDGETVYFDGPGDLAEKILRYHRDDALRAKVARAGRERYHRIFSGERVLKFMVETMCDEEFSERYEWGGEVYR